MTLQKIRCLLAVMETWHLSARAYFCLFYGEMLLETLLRSCVRGSDRNITVFLQSSSTEPWQLRSFAKPGKTSGSGTTTATRQDYRQTRKESSLIRGRSRMHFIRTGAGFILPVDCLHAQILGPQVHCVHRRSQSSLVRCILPAPAWRCSSSGQQSSELHSARQQSECRNDLRLGVNWRKNGPLQNQQSWFCLVHSLLKTKDWTQVCKPVVTRFGVTKSLEQSNRRFMCWTVLSWLTGNISRLQPRKSPTYSIKPSKATTFSSFKALSSSLFADLTISWSPGTSQLRSRLVSCRANVPQNFPVFAKLFSTESKINYRPQNMTRGSHLAQELVVELVFVCDKQWHNRLTHLHIFFFFF